MDAIIGLFNFKYLIIAALVFIPLEHFLPMHKEQKHLRKGLGDDIVYAVLNTVIVGGSLLAIVVASVLAREAFMPAYVVEWIRSQPIWIQTIEAIFIADLLFYLMHRLFHTVPFLWKFHAIHHSIEEMDWIAAFKVHPVDQILTKGASLVPCFFLGFSDAAIIAFYAIYQWHSLMLHANIRINFGPFKWLLASPDFHHWHHTNRIEAWDKNYAGQVSLWDVIFRTAHMPKGQRPGDYGVNDPLPEGYIAQFAHPFKPSPEMDTEDNVQVKMISVKADNS